MLETFSSSIACGGQLLSPESIIITDTNVIWSKRTGLFSRSTIEIKKRTINGVILNESFLFGSEIIISSFGSSSIYASSFTKSDARRIKELLVN